VENGYSENHVIEHQLQTAYKPLTITNQRSTNRLLEQLLNIPEVKNSSLLTLKKYRSPNTFKPSF